jgi:glycosyltransferase involved in cell wall biosynthesis
VSRLKSCATEMDAPVLSVLIPTYNHAGHIAQAIQGALEQEAPFPIEILVGDDCSTDGTTEIVREFERDFPGRVRVFVPDTNQGGTANFNRLYRAARGEFIAQLEGDDYWIDPKKLEKQVALLRERPELALCFHKVRIDYEDGSGRASEISNLNDPETSDLSRITRFNYICTASSVFRNRLIDGLPDWVNPLPLGDWPLFVLLAEHGDIGMIDEVMAVYRIHSGSTWGSKPEQYRLIQTVRVAEICREHLGHCGFDDCIAKMSNRIATTAWRNRNFRRAIKYTAKRLAAKRRLH